MTWSADGTNSKCYFIALLQYIKNMVVSNKNGKTDRNSMVTTDNSFHTSTKKNTDHVS